MVIVSTTGRPAGGTFLVEILCLALIITLAPQASAREEVRRRDILQTTCIQYPGYIFYPNTDSVYKDMTSTAAADAKSAFAACNASEFATVLRAPVPITLIYSFWLAFEHRGWYPPVLPGDVLNLP